MSNYKVEFTLKQHTPIIHFQSDQHGATLRASELKPKFDKFLKKYIFKGDIPKEYKISNDKDALDYKVKIENISSLKEILTYKTFISKRDKDNPKNRVGSYFGKENSILFRDGVKILFISFNKKLLSLIKENFTDFLNITNFSTRQNKGFGSFSVMTINNEKINNDVESSFLKYYPIVYKTTSNNPLETIMKNYQLLKSGTSKPQYKKSLLFEYMCNSKIRWEKRMIKEYMRKDYSHIYQTLKYEKQPIECRNERQFEYEYIRGLLGVAEQIEFLGYKGKIRVQIKSDDESVERFKSPITFKVIGKNIYVLASNDIPIKGKKFKFSIRGEKGILNEAIEVPKNFDIFKFLDFSLPKLKYTKLKAQI